ncbi:MAG TPA: thioredoxin-disulfide reductase [bacterium]|nr:thioredoxin-disulfide reductase [bacterium]
MPSEDLLIVGSGIAGFTAAIYAGRANLFPLVLSGMPLDGGGGVLGGQLTTTTEVENFPGFEHGIQGPDLMATVQKQAERFGTRVEQDHVQSVDFSKRPYVVKTVNGKTHEAASLVIATGASAKYLNLPSEHRLKGRGVSACATCDGFFFRGKELYVIGGGDTAMEEAIFLTKFASKVTILHRRDVFRASPIMLKRAKENPKVVFRTPFTVAEVLGENKVEGLLLQNTETHETETVQADGLFMGIGHTPNTAAFKGLDMDEVGYLITDERTRALVNGQPLPGVFAAGDVSDTRYRQAITAAGKGCAAGLEAIRFLEDVHHIPRAMGAEA